MLTKFIQQGVANSLTRSEIVKINGIFRANPSDPDCGTADITGVDSGRVVITNGLDSSISIESTTSPLGARAIFDRYDSGTSTTSRVTTEFSSDGNVTGQSSGTSTGNTIGAGAGGSGSGSGSGGSCGGSGQEPCVISGAGVPSGSGVNADGKAGLDAVTPNSLGLSAYTLGFGFSSWTGLPIIGGSDGCVNPSAFSDYHIAGVTVPFDVCSVWSPFKSWLAWMLWAFTGISIYLRATRLLGGAR